MATSFTGNMADALAGAHLEGRAAWERHLEDLHRHIGDYAVSLYQHGKAALLGKPVDPQVHANHPAVKSVLNETLRRAAWTGLLVGAAWLGMHALRAVEEHRHPTHAASVDDELAAQKLSTAQDMDRVVHTTDIPVAPAHWAGEPQPVLTFTMYWWPEPAASNIPDQPDFLNNKGGPVILA